MTNRVVYALVAPYRGGGFAIWTRYYQRSPFGMLLASDQRPYKHIRSEFDAMKIIGSHGWTPVRSWGEAEAAEKEKVEA